MSDWWDDQLRAIGRRRITEAEEEWIDEHTEIKNDGHVTYAIYPAPGGWEEGTDPDGHHMASYVVPIDWTIPEEGETT